jgi:hypothetical protein
MSWLSWDVWQIPLESCLLTLVLVLPFALRAEIAFAWRRRRDRQHWERAARPVDLAAESKRVLKEIRSLKGVPEEWTRDRV